MVNKKGYIKTLEAMIAVIMIVVISYMLIPSAAEAPPEVPSVLKGAQKIITQSVQLNETIRGLITKKYYTGYEKCEMLAGINEIITKYAPLGYDYTCAVCSKPGECLACTPIEKNIYMTDVLVASSEEQQNVKIVRIWFWTKPTPTEWKYDDTWRNKCRTTVPCPDEDIPEPLC